MKPSVHVLLGPRVVRDDELYEVVNRELARALRSEEWVRAHGWTSEDADLAVQAEIVRAVLDRAWGTPP